MTNPLQLAFRDMPIASNRILEKTRSFQDTDQQFKRHQQLVIENWWFYHGYHNWFLERFKEEQIQDYSDRVAHATIENHIKPIINLMVSHLYSKNDAIKRFVNRNGVPADDLNKILSESVWNQNTTREHDDTKALNTMVTGYSLIQRQFYDMRTDKLMNPNESFKIKQKYGYVKKTPLDSCYAMPLPYIDENGIVYPEKLGAVLYIADYDNFIGSTTAMELLGRARIQQSIVEYVDESVWIRWVKNPKDEKYTQQTMFPGTPWENRNPFGRIDIPFTIYRNSGDPFYVEGTSDVFDLKSLNMEINELSTGDKDTIRYHQYPILKFLKGAKMPKDFVRTKDAGLEFDKEGDADYLTWEGKLTESRERQENLRRSMSFVNGMSMLSRGFMKDIGQIRSGPPLKALFTSDRAVMSRKFMKFQSAEIQEMKADLLFYLKMTGQTLDIDKTISFHAEFNEDFLGIDKLLEAEIQTLQVQAGTKSIKEILKDEHPEWSEKELDSAIKEIQKFKIDTEAKIISKSGDKKSLSQTTE